MVTGSKPKQCRYNLNNIRHEASRYFWNKKKEYQKPKTDELENNSKIKYIWDLYRDINDFKQGYQPRTNTQGCWQVLSPTLEGNKLQWPRLTILYQDLWHTNNRNIFLLFVCHKSSYSIVSLGRCSLFPSKVALRTCQRPGSYRAAHEMSYHWLYI